MRVTVDIEDETLASAMAMTGEKQKSRAMAKAVEEYVRKTHLKEFANLIMEGAFDYPMTNEELEEEMDVTIGENS